ncbi:hypothetical protein GCM10020331_007620 [Ectobacillus funiculus]
MNEVGEISIDSNEVPAETQLCELLNGCICCSIRGRLETQLLSFIQEHSLDAIYIECTGVAHPVEVLEACVSPLLVHKNACKEHYNCSRFITLERSYEDEPTNAEITSGTGEVRNHNSPK